MLLGLFFLSGATALIYEVVWTRLLTLSFGSTILAVSTVLSAFMGGLAIGSALIGRQADKATQPIRLYAGIYAMATPLLFPLIEGIYANLHGYMTAGFWQSVLLRFVLSMLLLVPPTIMMGATLPVLSKVFLDGKSEHTGRALSVLYFINTAGAVIGTVAAGFFLLQLMGIRLLLLACGLVNVGIFLLAYRMSTHLQEGLQRPELALHLQENHVVHGRWSSNALLANTALFLSGLSALVYEVVWTRILTLVIGSSIYAFTIMLATFLTGIALGSAIVGRFSDNRTYGIGHLALCQVLIGVFAIVTASIFGVLPDAFVSLFGAVGERFALFLAGNFILCFIVMLPATLFMGASFPIAGAVAVETFASSGRTIGLLYAFNTIGAIIGAFLAGFVLLSTIGIQHTLIVAILINIICGLFLSTFSFLERPLKRNLITPVIAACIVLVLVLVWQPGWDKQKMTSGPYAYAAQYQKTSIADRLSKMEHLFYREGPISTVSVIREGKHIRLLVDGKTDAGNFRDMTTQVLIGHLPLLIKPDAKDVLVIGFASGITAGAVAQHDVSRIDCVEIEPAMKDASTYFERENFHIMDDERFKLIIDDGRSYVLTTTKKYDVVVSEPSNPWQSGSSRLFTREAFSNARNVLKENGLMVQWMHLYGVDVKTFRLVARTFMSVFPHATLWLDPVFADVIFVGSVDKLNINPLSISKMYKENLNVRNSLSRIGYSQDWSLMKAFLLGEEELKHFVGTGDLNTDDLPLLEYRAPKSLYSRTAFQDNKKALFDSKSSESFPRIAVNNGDEIHAGSLLRKWGESLSKGNILANAKGALLKASALNPSDYLTHFELGYLRMYTGNASGAMKSFEKSLSLNPTNGSAYANLGTLYYRNGEMDKAYSYLRKAISLGEDSSNIRNNLSVVLARRGRLQEAIEQVEIALSLNANDAIARKNMKKFQELLANRK
jgi:spermidine synthase